MKNAILLLTFSLLITLAARSQSDNNRVFYYENGKKKSEGHVNNGKQEGMWVFYYENGRKKSEGIYQGGKKYGEWTQYWSNGEMKSQGKYILHGGESVPSGTWTWYHKNGVKEKEGDFVQGQKKGVWKEWNSNEQQTGQRTY